MLSNISTGRKSELGLTLAKLGLALAKLGKIPVPRSLSTGAAKSGFFRMCQNRGSMLGCMHAWLPDGLVLILRLSLREKKSTKIAENPAHAEFPSDQLLPAACMLLADRRICWLCSRAFQRTKHRLPGASGSLWTPGFVQ